jgi:MFS family permease
MSDLRELARLPHFRAFLAARIISNLGNGMAPVALAFAVLGLPNATATSLSIILGVQAAVVVAVLPFGGVWADRIGRIRAIAGSDMILGLLLIAQAVLFLTHLITVPMLIGFASITGFLHAIWYPSFTSVAPAVVPADKLQSANSMISGVSAGASILGGASAGVVVATIGAPWALLFDAFTFIVAGALVWTLRSLILPSSSKDTTWQQLKTGWGEFRATRWVFVIVISFSFILMFFYGAHSVLGRHELGDCDHGRIRGLPRRSRDRLQNPPEMAHAHRDAGDAHVCQLHRCDGTAAACMGHCHHQFLRRSGH